MEWLENGWVFPRGSDTCDTYSCSTFSQNFIFGLTSGAINIQIYFMLRSLFLLILCTNMFVFVTEAWICDKFFFLCWKVPQKHVYVSNVGIFSAFYAWIQKFLWEIGDIVFLDDQDNQFLEPSSTLYLSFFTL